MSTSDAGNVADLNTDDAVNFRDFARFGGSRPINRVLLPGDLDRSGYLNFVDVKMLIDAWLWQR